MTGKAVGWAFDQKIEVPSHKLVLVCLADAADDYGICFPGLKTIARKTSLSRDTVIRSLKELVNYGLIEKVSRITGSGRQTSNAYKLPIYHDCIDDHPLSSLFKFEGSTAQPTSSTAQPPSSTAQPPSSTAQPLETPFNPHLNKKEKKPLTREGFLRGIDGGYNGGDFQEFEHLTETEIKAAAEACLDFYAAKGEWPAGDPVPVIRHWIRGGIKNGKIRKPAPINISAEGEREAKSASPLQSWHEKVKSRIDENVFRAWIRPLWFDGENLCAPTRFHADRVRDAYLDDLRPFIDAAIIHKPYQPQTESKIK